MVFQGDLAWMGVMLLATVRLGALFVMAPVFGGIAMPVQVRVIVVLAFAVTLVAGLPVPEAGPPLQPWPLLVAAVRELALGAAMAFGLFAAFGTFQFAGKILDIQIGFSLGSVFDPATRTHAPMLGTALNTLALALFFAIDGHHMLLRAVAYSLHKLPPGHWPHGWSLVPFVDQFGAMFVLGLTVVAPVVVALFLVDVGLGVVSRTMPQLNVFTVGIPAKIVVGLLALASTLVAMAPVMARVFQSLFGFWQQLMA
jgi:flagellar biosynthetic protein FliR